MNNKLEILLQQFNLSSSLEKYADLELIKVIVHQNNSYTFYLNGINLLKFDDYRNLISGSQHFPYDVQFNFQYQNKQYEEFDLKLYLAHILEESKANGKFIPLNLNQVKFGQNICFEACNQIELDQLNQLKKDIEVKLKNYGIDIEITVMINSNNEQFQEIQKEMEVFKPIEMDLSSLEKTSPATPEKPNYGQYRRNNNQATKMLLNEITDSTAENNVLVEGYVFKTDMIKIKSGKSIQTLWITDYTDSIIVKRFENNTSNSIEQLKLIGKGGVWVSVKGEIRFDAFAKETVIMAREVEILKKPKGREDKASQKRVELHTHTKMSTMDGINTISDYASLAASFGHTALALTDHGNAQSFPEAQSAAKANGLKMIYGVEMNMVDPKVEICFNPIDRHLIDTTFVSFDLETTGFSVVHDGITEIGAVKIKNGEVIDKLQVFINPQKKISSKIINLTGITNEMVQNAPTIQEYMPKLLEFFDDCILVAHNAKFDVNFINENLSRMNLEPLKNPIVDTLALARVVLKPMKSYRLGNVCRQYKVAYDEEVAHRADYDAKVLGDVFTMMLYNLTQVGKCNLMDIASMTSDDAYKLVFPSHMTMLACNRVGLKNMFKLITQANTTYFHSESRIPRAVLSEMREGLIFGSSCYRGEVFELALNGSTDKLTKAIQFYDYIEIQPLEDYEHLVDRGKVAQMDDIKKSIQRIIDIAKKENKIIVATGDVHFLNPKDRIYRDVFISNPTIGINHRAHPLCDRKNPKALNPNQYFRTTDEMLEAFEYLGHDEAYEYVVTNTNKIADMIEEIKPVHDKLFTPHIDGADENLKQMCYDNAHAMYGNPLPTIVQKRLDRELENIIKHGFGVIYYISHKLVKKSNEDGYLVGSRGSVGSSFVATMSGITEVNPLPPHYVCLSCSYNEFMEEGFIANGYDLPPKACPKCGKDLKGEGHNIPFETFLGFEADKVPDIDLNFSGAYQSIAHDYTKELFGEDYVYRAGTISTVAQKTAYGYAKGYAELMGIDHQIRSAQLEHIAAGCEGVKRTSGQHPGGIIVIPSDMDVYDFTPVQFPADDVNSNWKTTHFDFHAIHDNVLKLDILGHVDPTVIRALQDLTGVDPKTIPTNDQNVMSLFSTTKALGIDLSFINCNNGALGLPEFGTSFVRGMLDQTKPKDFNDLVIISGLSHGTDVYLGNAEALIKSGQCTLSQVIGCRDDIMVYLIEKGLPNKDAFDIMEVVRKGKSSAVFPQKNYEELMKKHNVPQWYIDSCKKIKYMFPKAHAAAYVLSAVRVAWWKLYHPREYYSVYFSTRCDFYEIETLVAGKEAILQRRQEITELRANRQSSNKDEGLWDVFEIALEMIERGFKIKAVDLELSDAKKFILDPHDDKALIPPFSAVDSLGVNVASTVIEARKLRPFISKEDVIKRTKLNNSHIKLLSKMGVFNGMQEENQLSLF